MSKRRNTTKATAWNHQAREEIAASGRNATISSHTMAPWSDTPRSRPVISQAQTPRKKSGIARNAMASGGSSGARIQ